MNNNAVRHLGHTIPPSRLWNMATTSVEADARWLSTDEWMLESITRWWCWSNAIAFFACIATFSFAYLGFADNADFGFDPEEFLTRLFDIVLKEKKKVIMPITFVLKPSLLFFLCLFYVLSLYPFVFSFLLFLLSETSYDVFVFRKWQTTHFFFCEEFN